MERATVANWMTPNPFTITADRSLIEAYHLMRQHSIRRLPVVEDGTLIGIVTMNDIRGAAPMGSIDHLEMHKVIANIKVRRVMTRKIYSVQASAKIQEAVEILLKHKFGGLPVLDGDRLVGIISEADIFRLLIEQPEILG